jgi:plasmid stability protein
LGHRNCAERTINFDSTSGPWIVDRGGLCVFPYCLFPGAQMEPLSSEQLILVLEFDEVGVLRSIMAHISYVEPSAFWFHLAFRNPATNWTKPFPTASCKSTATRIPTSKANLKFDNNETEPLRRQVASRMLPWRARRNPSTKCGISGDLDERGIATILPARGRTKAIDTACELSPRIGLLRSIYLSSWSWPPPQETADRMLHAFDSIRPHNDRALPMAGLSVRRLDAETLERLRIRAAEHGVSMEEEARRILAAAVAAPNHLGDLAVRLFGSTYDLNLELVRATPHEPLKLDD